MADIRTAHSLGVKEVAFKDFRMGQIRRALPDYLEAMNAVPGFLFTLAVDKKVTSLFGLQNKANREAAMQLLSNNGGLVSARRKPS